MILTAPRNDHNDLVRFIYTLSLVLLLLTPTLCLAGKFNPIKPLRVLDTRLGVGAAAQPLEKESTIELQISGQGDLPDSMEGGTVVLNLTSTASTDASFIVVWPTGETRPDASNLNTEPGQDTPNLVFAKIGDDGKVSIYNNSGSAHLIADVMGWAPSDSGIVPISPERVLDTRFGIGIRAGAMTAGETIDVDLSDVVQNAVAAVMNVTSTESSDPSFVAVWEQGENLPPISNLNTEPGQDTPNLVISEISKDNQVSIYNHAGTTHLIADVVAYMLAGSTYNPIHPARIMDTRSGVGGKLGPLAGKMQFNLQVPGISEGEASSVVMNVTSTESTESAFVTVWPSDETQPNASNLNTEPGQDTPNLVIAKLSQNDMVSFYTNTGSTHLVADLIGWFSAEEPITTPKELIFSTASGHKKDYNGVKTELPFHRNDITASNSSQSGKVYSAIGPAQAGKDVHGELFIFRNFDAHRENASVQMSVTWNINLFSLAGANASSEAKIILRVKEVGGPTIASHTYYSDGLGLEAIQGLDNLKSTETENIAFNVSFDQGKRHRLELEVECKVRTAFSLGATQCVNDVKINSWSVTFDEGV